MRQVIGTAKKIYYFFFITLAYLLIRRRGDSSRRKAASDVINIVSRFGVQNGLSNGALYQYRALQALGYTVNKIDITAAYKNPFRMIDCPHEGTFVFHCAASQFLQYAWPLRRAIKDCRLVGYFAWELAEPPADWPVYRGIWDEIWTTSRFSAQSLAKKYDCPIHVLGHVLLGQKTAQFWHKGRGKLTFLTMADGRSSLVRKNPDAVISAFRQAFPSETDVALIVKLSIHRASPLYANLLDMAGGDSRIRIIAETLTRDEVDALIATAHVYVSLHRAEGFGLPLLEARTAGLATIATAWSGNMDFMTAEDSALVPSELKRMVDEGGVYGRVTWADPNVGAAANAMRRFYDDPDHLNTIAKRGFEASQPQIQLSHFASALQAALGNKLQPIWSL